MCSRLGVPGLSGLDAAGHDLRGPADCVCHEELLYAAAERLLDGVCHLSCSLRKCLQRKHLYSVVDLHAYLQFMKCRSKIQRPAPYISLQSLHLTKKSEHLPGQKRSQTWFWLGSPSIAQLDMHRPASGIASMSQRWQRTESCSL